MHVKNKNEQQRNGTACLDIKLCLQDTYTMLDYTCICSSMVFILNIVSSIVSFLFIYLINGDHAFEIGVNHPLLTSVKPTRSLLVLDDCVRSVRRFCDELVSGDSFDCLINRPVFLSIRFDNFRRR